MQASHEETLTDPLTATQMPYNDHEHNLYHRSENRNSVASVLNPLNFEQVESKPRPPQQLRVSTDKDEDKKLVSLVSPDCDINIKPSATALLDVFGKSNIDSSAPSNTWTVSKLHNNLKKWAPYKAAL